MRAYPSSVDVYAIDDSSVGQRLARAQTQTLVTSGLMCKILHRDPTQVAAAGREEVAHSHRIHFKRNPGLTELNVLVWLPHNESTPVELAVIDTKRPPSKRFPWVVFANQIKTG